MLTACSTSQSCGLLLDGHALVPRPVCDSHIAPPNSTLGKIRLEPCRQSACNKPTVNLPSAQARVYQASTEGGLELCVVVAVGWGQRELQAWCKDQLQRAA
jgi:hypothetical protein